MKIMRTSTLLAFAAVILASCNPVGPMAIIPDSPGQPTPEQAPLVPPEEIVYRVQQDLAETIKVPPDEIETRNITAVSWPNAALGCPEPGQVYAEVITPGYRILLQVEDEVYEYRTDEVGSFVHCAGGQPFE